MEKLFEKYGYSENDMLPFAEVELLSDMKGKAFSEKNKQLIITLAEKELERPLLAIPMSAFVGYYHGTHPERIPEFMERRRGAILLSLAESIEGKGRFVNRLIDLVWCILEETVWFHPAHLHKRDDGSDAIIPPVCEEGFKHNVDLRTGITIGTLSMVYYLSHELFDSITPLLNQRIIKEVREKALYPYIERDFWWEGCGDTKVINWGTWISSNLLLTVACLESDENIRRAVFSKVLKTLNAYTLNYSFDGGCDEGPGYWGASCGCFLDCLDLLYDISGGKINIYGEPHVRRMFEFAPKYNIHDKQSINLADAGPKNTYSPGLHYRMGVVTDSELLKSFAGFMVKYKTGLDIVPSTPYRSLRSFYEKPIEFCEFKAAKSVWFPDLKVGYFREFEDTSKGMFVCMGGGSNGTSHNHNDLGSVIVYYGGNPVFIDTGVGRYDKNTFGSKRYTLTKHSSGYHNTVNIGGVLQRNGGQYHTDNEFFDENAGIISMDVTNAYPEEAGINSYVRAVSLKGGRVEISDSFDLDGEKEIDIHFVTHGKPKILPDGSVSLIEGRVMRYDSSLDASIEAYPAHDDVIEERWGTKELYNIHLKGVTKKGTFLTTIE